MSQNRVLQFINYVCHLFFKDDFKEIYVKRDNGLELTEAEFDALIGSYHSSNSVINGDIHTDEYTYDIDDMKMKKLTIDYMKKDDRYVILSIHGFTENG